MDMGVICSFGLQKGGVGKSTTTGLTSFLLSEKGEKVLAVDFDSQGNLTQFLTGESPYKFVHKTVLEAVKEGDPRPYIHHVSDNLDLLPAEDFLSGLGRWMYLEYKKSDMMLLLKRCLDTVRDQYDWIFLDLPPNLGEQTLSGIAASDFCVVVSMSEPFSMDAIERYLEIISATQQKIREDVQLAGILIGMLDSRTSLGQYIADKVREDYGDFVFNTVIRRKSRVTEFSFQGIQNRTKQDKEALEMYENFIEELRYVVSGQTRQV